MCKKMLVCDNNCFLVEMKVCAYELSARFGAISSTSTGEQ